MKCTKIVHFILFVCSKKKKRHYNNFELKKDRRIKYDTAWEKDRKVSNTYFNN